MTSAIIFDLDGTLLNTLADLRDSVNHSLSAFGYPRRTTEEVRRFVGNGIAKLVERATPDGLNNIDYPTILSETRRYYAQHCEDQTAPYDGILDMLHTLREMGFVLGVVSNKPDAQVKKLCQKHFGDCITVAVGSQDRQALKPAPYPLLRAMEELHSDAAHTVYIGDSDVDVETAANAGIPCISVLWGFRDKDEIVRAGGAVFVERAAEIPQLAARILAN